MMSSGVVVQFAGQTQSAIGLYLVPWDYGLHFLDGF